METSEPKWINSNGIQYGVNSLRLGDPHFTVSCQLQIESIGNIGSSFILKNLSHFYPIYLISKFLYCKNRDMYHIEILFNLDKTVDLSDYSM